MENVAGEQDLGLQQVFLFKSSYPLMMGASSLADKDYFLFLLFSKRTFEKVNRKLTLLEVMLHEQID